MLGQKRRYQSWAAPENEKDRKDALTPRSTGDHPSTHTPAASFSAASTHGHVTVLLRIVLASQFGAAVLPGCRLSLVNRVS